MLAVGRIGDAHFVGGAVEVEGAVVACWWMVYVCLRPSLGELNRQGLDTLVCFVDVLDGEFGVNLGRFDVVPADAGMKVSDEFLLRGFAVSIGLMYGKVFFSEFSLSLPFLEALFLFAVCPRVFRLRILSLFFVCLSFCHS